jgi:hypothetical protein
MSTASRYVREFFVAGLALLVCIPFLALQAVVEVVKLVWRRLEEVLLVAGIACLIYSLYKYVQPY